MTLQTALPASLCGEASRQILPKLLHEARSRREAERGSNISWRRSETAGRDSIVSVDDFKPVA